MNIRKKIILTSVLTSVFLGAVSGALVSEFTSKKTEGFYVYSPDVIEKSVVASARKASGLEPGRYSYILNSKFSAVKAKLEEISKQKEIYALGARIGGEDITEKVLSDLNIPVSVDGDGLNSYEKKTQYIMPPKKIIEKAKQEILMDLEKKLKDQKVSDSRLP